MNRLAVTMVAVAAPIRATVSTCSSSNSAQAAVTATDHGLRTRQLAVVRDFSSIKRGEMVTTLITFHRFSFF